MTEFWIVPDPKVSSIKGKDMKKWLSDTRNLDLILLFSVALAFWLFGRLVLANIGR